MNDYQPLVMVNGVADAQVSAFDRGFLYGDGLFETMRLEAGRVPLLERHLQRLTTDAARLNIACNPVRLREQFDEIIALATTRWQLASADLNATIKLVLTRGVGGRGYLSGDDLEATVCLQIFYRAKFEQKISSLWLCETRLAASALAGVKHCNRLEQILAAQEVQAHGCDEGLMCDFSGVPIEAVSNNIFVVIGGTLVTPAIGECGVAGVMRAWLIDNYNEHYPFKLRIEPINLATLQGASDLLLSNSNFGVRRVERLKTKVGEHSFSKTAVGDTLIALAQSVFVTQGAKV